MLHLLDILFAWTLVLSVRFPTLLPFGNFFLDFLFKWVEQILIFGYNSIYLLVQIVSFVYDRFLLNVDRHWIPLRLIDKRVESTVTNKVHWIISVGRI
jgi:hypothetical protein